MKRLISFISALMLLFNSVMPACAQGVWSAHLPEPGTQVGLTAPTIPAHLIGLTLDQSNPLLINFLINKGEHALSGNERSEEYKKVIKYFLAAMTIPDDDQWVNLSPYEKDRIIPDEFGLTEMGRDLLAEDYILKQLTASLIDPDKGLGKKFWDSVYEKAYATYGTTDIPIDTFNKVWIVPDDAVVFEKGNSVIILKTHLKVMLEQDYLALEHNSQNIGGSNEKRQGAAEVSKLSSEVVRKIIIPEIEKEVNSGEHFTSLRQIVGAMVLATWYKKALKASLLGEVYADKARVKGVDQDPVNNQQIYERYVKAFKKGVFNLIKEDKDRYTDELIPRKYFSGGYRWTAQARAQSVHVYHEGEKLSSDDAQAARSVDAATVSGNVDSVTTRLLENGETVTGAPVKKSVIAHDAGRTRELERLTSEIKGLPKTEPRRAALEEKRKALAVDHVYSSLRERVVEGRTVGNNEIASIVERYITDKESTDIQALLLEGKYTDKVLDKLMEISAIGSQTLTESLSRGVENGHAIRGSQEEYESKYVGPLKTTSSFFAQAEIEKYKNQAEYWKTEADWIAQRKTTDNRWSKFNPDGTLKTSDQERSDTDSLLKYARETLEPKLAELLQAFVQAAGLREGAFANVSYRTKGLESSLKKLEKLRSASWAKGKDVSIADLVEWANRCG